MIFYNLQYSLKAINAIIYLNISDVTLSHNKEVVY